MGSRAGTSSAWLAVPEMETHEAGGGKWGGGLQMAFGLLLGRLNTLKGETSLRLQMREEAMDTSEKRWGRCGMLVEGAPMVNSILGHA